MKKILKLLNPAPDISGGLPRLAFIGVGHPFVRDDRAGSLVIEAFEKQVTVPNNSLLLLNVSSSPENFLGPITRFCPDHMYLIDAVDMAKEPGSILTLEWTSDVHLDAQPFSLPLDKFCHYISLECQCSITIIGIQAHSLGFGSEVSENVLESVNALALQLYSEWQELAERSSINF